MRRTLQVEYTSEGESYVGSQYRTSGQIPTHPGDFPGAKRAATDEVKELRTAGFHAWWYLR